MFRAPRKQLLALALPVLVWTGCYAGFGSSQPATDLEIGAPGGTLEVQEGYLRGMTVTVPPGALESPVTLRVEGAKPTPDTGLQVVGATARISPEEVPLFRPVNVGLPFELALVPVGVPLEDLVVMHRDANNRLSQLIPYAVRVGAGFLDVQLSRLGTVWVASPQGVPLVGADDYFPLQDGNEWQFDGGVTLALRRDGAVPHLAGSYWVWTLTAGEQDLSFYLEETAGGSLQDVGRESQSLGIQELVDQPLAFLPGDLSGARRLVGQATTRVYSPIDSPNPIGVGDRTSLTEILGTTVVLGPLGPFENALEVVLLQRWDLAGLPGALEVRVWFGEGAGPVQLRLGSGPDMPVVRSLVGGVRSSI